MADRLKMPPVRDFGFYQRRKHDKWRAVPPPEPALEAPVADSHAHIHMLPDPAWELARCAANGVDFVCMIVDPSEDGARPFDELSAWCGDARASLPQQDARVFHDRARDVPQNRVSTSDQVENGPLNTLEPSIAARIATGVHPHNAKLYCDSMEATLLAYLDDSRVAALGEIGLDYHYDLSPRSVQRDAFRRQIEIAQHRELPLVLHLRGGEDPMRDNAHREAFDILREMNALGPHTLLHCCALPPEELSPWVEADCFIAYGGVLTFKSSDAAREGARLVPVNRLMLETDAPYMTPEPMRGATCTPAHIIFTAASLAETRGIAPGDERRAFLEQLHANTLQFFGA